MSRVLGSQSLPAGVKSTSYQPLWVHLSASRSHSRFSLGLTCTGCVSQDAWLRFLERTVVSNVPMLASPGCRPALLHDAVDAGYSVHYM